MNCIRNFIFYFCFLMVGLLGTPQLGKAKLGDGTFLQRCVQSFAAIVRVQPKVLPQLVDVSPQINMASADIDIVRNIANRENKIVLANNPRVSNAEIRFGPNMEAKPIELRGCRSLMDGKWKGYVGCSPELFPTRQEWLAYVEELNSLGYTIRDEADQFIVQRGSTRFYSDLDLFGVWNADNLAPGFDEAFHEILNSAFGVNLIRHGPWADYSMRASLDLPNEVVAFLPDGQVVHLTGEDELSRFISAQELDWKSIWPHAKPSNDPHRRGLAASEPTTPVWSDFIPIRRDWVDELPFVTTGERYFVELDGVPGLRIHSYARNAEGKFKPQEMMVDDILSITKNARAFVVGDNGNGTVVLDFVHEGQAFRIENYPLDNLRRFIKESPSRGRFVGMIPPRTRLRVFDRSSNGFVEAEYIGRQELQSYSVVVLDPNGKREVVQVHHSCIENPGLQFDESGCLFIFNRSKKQSREELLADNDAVDSTARQISSDGEISNNVSRLNARFGSQVKEGESVVFLDPLSGRWQFGLAGPYNTLDRRYVKRGQGYSLVRFEEIRDPNVVMKSNLYFKGEAVRFKKGSVWIEARVLEETVGNGHIKLAVNSERVVKVEANSVERLSVVGKPMPPDPTPGEGSPVLRMNQSALDQSAYGSD